MEWRVGDRLIVLTPDGQTSFERGVHEISSQLLTLQHLGADWDKRPMEKVKITQVELWWRERLLRVEV
jgi:hypothetical protein